MSRHIILLKLAVVLLTVGSMYGQSSFPLPEESPIWVVDNKSFGMDNCYVYIAGEPVIMQDTLWTEILRVFHPSSVCADIQYSDLLNPTGIVTVGYYFVDGEQIYGKKALNGSSYLVYDFSLQVGQITNVLFSFINPDFFDPSTNIRQVRVIERTEIELPTGDVTEQQELTADSSPFPPYINESGETNPEYWIRMVGASTNPFSSFDCVSYSCENSFRLYTLYTDQGNIRYQADWINPSNDLSELADIDFKVVGREVLIDQASPDYLKLSLFNLQGQLLAKHSITDQSSVWTLPMINANGIYVIQLQKARQQLSKRIWLEKS